MSIYDYPDQYAQICGCSIEIAKKRCNTFLKLHEAYEKVTCPACGASSELLIIDSDGSDYSTEDIITCEACWESFDMSDARLKPWVDFIKTFDDFLYVHKD